MPVEHDGGFERHWQAADNGDSQRMTKADLLHRFRWVFVLLPASIAVGFICWFLSLVHMQRAGVAIPNNADSIWKMSLWYLLYSWAFLTFLCSTLTALLLAEKAQMHGVQRLIFVVAVAPLILCLHAALCVGIFTILLLR